MGLIKRARRWFRRTDQTTAEFPWGEGMVPLRQTGWGWGYGRTRWVRRNCGLAAALAPAALDHEHPCPSSGCLDYWRRRGYDVPADMDCCICWFRQRWEGKL